MRIFQNIHLYAEHVAIINAKAKDGATFAERIAILKSEGLNGAHILAPMIENSDNAFLTSTADPSTQRQWALENGLSENASPHEILVAQIEAFKPDVFYTHGTGYFPETVLKRIPSLCKINVCWKGPPDFTNNLSSFKLLVNNFPSSLPKYRAMAQIETGYLTPSFDPAMEPYCFNHDRPVDVLFAGSYSRHHRRRAEIVEALSALPSNIRVALNLNFDRLTQLANTPLGLVPGLQTHRVPTNVRRINQDPLFGVAMYKQLASAKIVVNCAIDVAGADRGNMRCFEAMGCGALLVSDKGSYPPGMVDGETMVTYSTPTELVETIAALLQDEPKRARVAAAGLELARSRYGKAAVWKQFQSLVSKVRL
jgi:Glycosyl transferases group 1